MAWARCCRASRWRLPASPTVRASTPGPSCLLRAPSALLVGAQAQAQIAVKMQEASSHMAAQRLLPRQPPAVERGVRAPPLPASADPLAGVPPPDAPRIAWRGKASWTCDAAVVEVGRSGRDAGRTLRLAEPQAPHVLTLVGEVEHREGWNSCAGGVRLMQAQQVGAGMCWAGFGELHWGGGGGQGRMSELGKRWVLVRLDRDDQSVKKGAGAVCCPSIPSSPCAQMVKVRHAVFGVPIRSDIPTRAANVVRLGGLGEGREQVAVGACLHACLHACLPAPACPPARLPARPPACLPARSLLVCFRQPASCEPARQSWDTCLLHLSFAPLGCP